MTIQLIFKDNQTFNNNANYKEEESMPLSKVTSSKITQSTLIFFKEFQTFYKVL